MTISRFLRLVLIADAVASGATGLLLLAGAGLLESWLGLPAALMREAGLVLIPFVLCVGWLSTRRAAPVWAIEAVILCNALWVVGSILALLLVSPTTLGYAFVIAQAAAVGLFGLLQYAGLRRSGTAIA